MASARSATLRWTIAIVFAFVLGGLSGWGISEFWPHYQYDAEWSRLKGLARQRLVTAPGYAANAEVLDRLLDKQHEELRRSHHGRPSEKGYVPTILLFMYVDANELNDVGAMQVLEAASPKQFPWHTKNP